MINLIEPLLKKFRTDQGCFAGEQKYHVTTNFRRITDGVLTWLFFRTNTVFKYR